jgi:ribosomal protein L37AE/L43A
MTAGRGHRAVILLPMQADPIAEWQRLTELYREMNDGELEELDADKTDLTEVAQQVLRDELRKRGLDDAHKLSMTPNQAGGFGASRWGTGGVTAADEGTTSVGDQLVEYTWKTLLCEREDPEERWQIQEVLRQAGIESWIDIGGYSVTPEIGTRRIVVAADQLEKACEILAKPIPREIVEQAKLPVEEYMPPACPSCGTEEPILESANPVNSWRCESCGKRWTEQEEEQEGPAQQQPTHRASQEENPFTPGPLTML